MAVSGSRQRPILVFDSGVGGLTVLREIRARMPERDCVYVADDRGFPYGAWSETDLCRHILALMEDLIGRLHPALVVMACNTASTLVLQPLREAFPSMPFVGTVPAIKLARARTRSGCIAVLATPGTVRRTYTRNLIHAFASDCEVRLVGAEALAAQAERLIRGDSVNRDRIGAEMGPCFYEIGRRRTDTVVLGCTHYPFLIDLFRQLAPWPVEWLDPAEAIARRTASLLPPVSALEPAPEGRAWFTSGDMSPVLRSLMAGFGLTLMPALS